MSSSPKPSIEIEPNKETDKIEMFKQLKIQSEIEQQISEKKKIQQQQLIQQQVIQQNKLTSPNTTLPNKPSYTSPTRQPYSPFLSNGGTT